MYTAAKAIKPDSHIDMDFDETHFQQDITSDGEVWNLLIFCHFLYIF